MKLPPCRNAYCNGLCAVCDTMSWMDSDVPPYSEDCGTAYDAKVDITESELRNLLKASGILWKDALKNPL